MSERFAYVGRTPGCRCVVAVTVDDPKNPKLTCAQQAALGAQGALAL